MQHKLENHTCQVDLTSATVNDKFFHMKAELISSLKLEQGTLRGAMEALKSNLEEWERKEFEQVRRAAITRIRKIVKGLLFCNRLEKR